MKQWIHEWSEKKKAHAFVARIRVSIPVRILREESFVRALLDAVDKAIDTKGVGSKALKNWEYIPLAAIAITYNVQMELLQRQTPREYLERAAVRMTELTMVDEGYRTRPAVQNDLTAHVAKKHHTTSARREFSGGVTLNRFNLARFVQKYQLKNLTFERGMNEVFAFAVIQRVLEENSGIAKDLKGTTLALINSGRTARKGDVLSVVLGRSLPGMSHTVADDDEQVRKEAGYIALEMALHSAPSHRL